jgi:hypothetical protein
LSDVRFSLQNVVFCDGVARGRNAQDRLQETDLKDLLRSGGVAPYASAMPLSRVSLVLLAVLVLALSGCGSGGAASGGDDPASAAPRDAAMYFEATVRPAGSQREDALDALGKVLATPDPQAKIDELVQQAFSSSDGLKLDYARDVKPWLGEKVGFWLAAGRSGEDPKGAAILSSTDSDKAQAAVDRAVKDSGETFTKKTYKDIDYQVNQDGGAAAVDEDFVLLGSEAELKKTIDTLDGGKPIADDERYRKAIDGLDEDRLASLFFDVKALLDAALRSDPQAAAQFEQFKRVFPIDGLGPAVASFSANGDRLLVDGVTPGGADLVKRFGALSGTGSTPLLGELPGDSWLALGSPKFGQTAKELYQQLAGALGGAAIQQQLRSELGLDLEQDVFSWIGDVAFFVRGTTENTVDGGAVIEVTDDERAKAAFGKLIGLAQSRGGVKAKPVSIPGAETAFAATTPGAPKPVVAARTAGRVVIAYGEAAAAAALKPEEKLADTASYGDAKALLGGDVEPGFLLSMPEVVQLVGASDPDPDFAKAKPYLDAFTIVAAGGKVDGDTARSKFAAGLK